MSGNSKKNMIKALFSITFWKEYPYRKRIDWLLKLCNSTIRQQRKDSLSIPVIIISYNRLSDLEELVSFLLNRQHKNIVIVDNNSSYPPLLDYYKKIEDRVAIKRLDDNTGHLVFWLKKELFNEYASGYYIVTDSDIIPNNNLPADYIKQMLDVLDKHKDITKVGFALRIDDIPDTFTEKQKVVDWESVCWENEIAKDMYSANIDTTFALYAPRYKYLYDTFYKAIRMGGNFSAKHRGWYIDSKNQTEEELFYYKTANASNSWKLNEKGQIDENETLYG